MTIKEYQKYVSAGMRSSRARVEFMSIALAGEVGELLNEIKHFIIDNPEEDGARELDSFEARLRIIDELGDVLWYFTALCSVLDIDFEQVIAYNVDKLNERYGE